MSTLSQFLDALWEAGRVRVGQPADLTATERAEALAQVIAMEKLIRLDAPGEPPPFDPEAAMWAAEMLHRACQLAVFREYGAENIAAAFADPGPLPSSPSAHYSVDLVFRFLPDLHRLTHRAAPGDPLVAQIAVWAAAWPLSSVGVANVKVHDEPLAVVLSHTSLRQQYIDRIFARHAAERLQHAPTREAALAAVGLHTMLAGDLEKQVRDQTIQGQLHE